jgi:hypothetical protein
MKLKDLIGYQLVSINQEKIIVRKGDKEYTLFITEDYGGCCGYNEINTNLLVSETELANNPIITNVETDGEDYGNGDRAKLTIFGVYKPLAVVESHSSSGSGWRYGACVSIICDALKIEETLTEW